MSETRVNLKVPAPLFAAVLPDGAFVGCFTVPNMEWTEVPPRRISCSVNGDENDPPLMSSTVALWPPLKQMHICHLVKTSKAKLSPKMAMSVFPLIADDLVVCVCVFVRIVATHMRAVCL